MFKWVEIHLFLQRSSWLQHTLCLNKPPVLEAFFSLSVSPSPSPWAPIDVSSHFYVWHLKKQLKRIAPICKRKATFLKDKTGFSAGGMQTPWKILFDNGLGKVNSVCACMHSNWFCTPHVDVWACLHICSVMFCFAFPSRKAKCSEVCSVGPGVGCLFYRNRFCIAASSLCCAVHECLCVLGAEDIGFRWGSPRYTQTVWQNHPELGIMRFSFSCLCRERGAERWHCPYFSSCEMEPVDLIGYARWLHLHSLH